jgi:dihydrofolate reductase
MRTVTYGAACSLDGFITGPDESLDWLHWSKDAEAIMAAYWKPVDTILMGRKTWEVSLRLGNPPALGPMRSYVFSRTLEAIDRPGVTLVKDDPGEFVRVDCRRRVALELKETRPIEGGCVYSVYRVTTAKSIR